MPILMGVEDALGAGQISVFLCDSRDDPIRERHHVETLQRRRVDGFIVTGRSSNSRSPLPVEPSFPVVYALSPSSDPRDCSVVVDDVAIGRIAGDHFVRMGRTRVAHISGPESFDAARERAQGLEGALQSEGLELVDQVYYGNWSEAWADRPLRWRCGPTRTSMPSTAARISSPAGWEMPYGSSVRTCPATSL
ncbi:type 1 periplasmic-binding domain-containing protein [Tessaracoccus coleopterorum]|uniref:hypothetical protein n=1 Tax=Tessaracoccus coleopterorum TaxID=2714950 RepID=UPI002F9163E0